MDVFAIAKKVSEVTPGESEVAPPGVTMRRATLDDFQAIQDLTSEAARGHDYLVAKYDQYMQDSDRYIYVAVKDGQVVCAISH